MWARLKIKNLWMDFYEIFRIDGHASGMNRVILSMKPNPSSDLLSGKPWIP